MNSSKPDETDSKSDITSSKVTNAKSKNTTPTSPQKTISQFEPESSKSKIFETKNQNEKFVLPLIPDYDRPDLELYEKSDFNPSDFSRKLEIPAKSKFSIPNGNKEPKPVESNISAKKSNVPSSDIKDSLSNPKKSDSKTSTKITENINFQSPKSTLSNSPETNDVDMKANAKATSSSRWKKYEDLEEESFFSTSPPFSNLKSFDIPEHKLASDESLSTSNTNAMKDLDSFPIAITITEPEEVAKKSVTFDAGTKNDSDDSQKKKKPRRTYDPLAWIPDEEIVEETQAQNEEDDVPTPIPKIPNRPKRVYDPLAYIPDKEDVASENIIIEDDQVNTRY